MKTLEIVVHVYSESIAAYAKMFSAQLSSLIYYPPKNCQVEFTVWTAETDALTLRVIDAFQRRADFPGTVDARFLPKVELFRRAIGRNISAKECTADIQWMADADYLLYDGCLDSIAAVDFDAIKPAEMVFPAKYFMQESHEIGDKELATITPGEPWLTDKRNYFKKRLKLGIGGLQILPREVARRGYLDNTKWVKPRIDETPFPDTDDDARFRRTIHSSVPANISNLFRMRHGCCSYEPPEERALRMNKKPKAGKSR